MPTLRMVSLGALATLLWVPAAHAQRPPTTATPNVTATPLQTPPTPPTGGLCCCRTWTRGFQYSWLASPQCATQNGTCVSPDHCGS